MTRCKESFLIHDSGARDDKRILIYATYDNIRYLSASTTLLSDGNFKIASTQFTQLFTLHGVVLGYTMPLIQTLTMKRQEDTGKVLAFIQERNVDINTSLCLMNFEIVNMNAIQRLLPNAQIKGACFTFHNHCGEKYLLWV